MAVQICRLLCRDVSHANEFIHTHTLRRGKQTDLCAMTSRQTIISRYIRLFVLLLLIQFAAFPLSGVSLMLLLILSCHLLHTMRVALLVLVIVDTHICMCLSAHVYA